VTAPCPFCALPEQRVLFRNGAAVAVRDAYPVSPGHTLVIPMRHVTSFFNATSSEREALLELLDTAKQQLSLSLARLATTSASMTARRQGKPSTTFTSI